MALVLVGSPELAAFAWDVRAAEARRLYTPRAVNPDIELTAEDALGTRSYSGLSQTQVTLRLEQVIELGGKSRARRDVAAGAEQTARREYELRRTLVLSEAATRFVHLVADQHRLELAREARQLAETGLAAAERRQWESREPRSGEVRRLILALCIDVDGLHPPHNAVRQCAIAYQ